LSIGACTAASLHSSPRRHDAPLVDPELVSWRRTGASSELYRKSWLLNEIVPDFVAEALRVKPSISKGATAYVPLHLRIALLAASRLPLYTIGTLRYLRPACRPF
jgi:hypothetical protein